VTDWPQIRERYRNYPCETLSYATVRDFCDSADHMPQILRFNSDLKDVQRPWAVKTILGNVASGSTLIEIGGGESRPSANAERPARAEMVGNPTDDRGANRCSPQCNANPQGHNPAPHRSICRELHDAVCAVGKGQGSRADDRESSREPPASRRECGKGTAEPEDAGSH